MSNYSDRSSPDTSGSLTPVKHLLPADTVYESHQQMQLETPRSHNVIPPKLSLKQRTLPHSLRTPKLQLDEPGAHLAYSVGDGIFATFDERITAPIHNSHQQVQLETPRSHNVIPPKLSLKQRTLPHSLRTPKLQLDEPGAHLSYNFGDGIFDEPTFDECVTVPVVAISKSIFDEDPEFDKHATIPMMVLKGVAERQGQVAPVMKSEISGATSNAALIGIGNLVGSVLKYCSSFLIQRGFGVGPFGLYSLGMSVISLFLSVLNLGLDDAMVRYVAIYQSKRQPGLLRGLTVFCAAAAAAAGILGAVLVFLFAPYIAAQMKAPAVLPLLRLMAFIIPVASVQDIWSSGLSGFKAFKWRLFSQRFVVPVVMVFGLILVLLFFHSLQGIVVVSLITTLVSAGLCLSFFQRKLSSFTGTSTEPREYRVREWLGFAVPNFMSSITDMVLESVDTLLLAFYAISSVGLGRYAAANKLSIFISMPLFSFNGMFAPTIAELYSKGEKQKLAIMFKIVTKWTIIFSLPIFLVTTLFSKSLLGISGDDFVGAWPLLVALSIGSFINAATGSVGYMLLMTGHQKLSFINSLVAVVVNLVLGIILTPRYGAMGTAVATGVALAVVNLMRLLQVWLLLKIHPYQWDVLKPMGAGVMSALVIAALLYFTGPSHWSIMVFKKQLSLELALVPVFLAFYVGLIVLFKFNAEDTIVLETLRKKIKRGKK